eukprot:GDKI01033606.1.p6 GENE.GDKI01033606.1~~GDKI01033606.1.p6  ORF type:complete len:103 (-),score=36.31 GDKI01033606.1:840-1148(-)
MSYIFEQPKNHTHTSSLNIPHTHTPTHTHTSVSSDTSCTWTHNIDTRAVTMKATFEHTHTLWYTYTLHNTYSHTFLSPGRCFVHNMHTCTNTYTTYTHNQMH